MKDWPWYGHLAVAVIIFLLAFLFYFKPKNREIQETRAERTKVEQEVMRLKAKKKQLDNIEKELAQLTNVLKELEQIIPEKKEIFNILRRIQQLAYDSRLNITKFIPQREIPQEFFVEQPISIEITGNYHNLGLFFDRLSRFARLFTIDSFRIKSLRQQTNALTISANFIAKTFIFREQPPPEQPPAKRRKK
jgi:Tfp pilus assembly protein PilO